MVSAFSSAMCVSMDFSVNSRLENGWIVCEICEAEPNEFTQYAYYLYDEYDNVLEKQGYISNSTFSFLPVKSGRYSVKGFVKYKSCETEEYQKKSKMSNIISFYKTKKIRYEELGKESFRVSDPTIYEVLWNDVRFEFLLAYKPDYKKAVVFGTGEDENTHRECLPMFQRDVWVNKIDACAIYYLDPTVRQFNIRYGWGYGNQEQWFLENIAVIILKILNNWGVSIDSTLFFGSSVGGFTALALATLLRGKVTVVNPQFVVPNFWPDLYKNFSNAVAPDGNLLKERLSITDIIEKEQYFPRVHLVQNILAKHDVLTQVTSFLNTLAVEEIDCKNEFEISFYSNQAGHDAMPTEEKCIAYIRQDILAELKEEQPESFQMPADSFMARYLSGCFELNNIGYIPEQWTEEDDKKLYIVITIDTEDKYSNVPNMFECDFGEEGNCGVNYIMDQLEQREMRGVFFTNIYEHLNYSGEYELYIEKLVKRISDRGHEVGLHAHTAGNTMEFYKNHLTGYDYDGQYRILKYGTDFITKHTGIRPVSYRGGGYACNEATLDVVSDLGYKIESSSFYGDLPNGGNRFRYFQSLNQVLPINTFLEFPVIAVFNNQGKLRKFDINNLNIDELKATVEAMKRRPYFNAAQIMLHSFSFMDQKGSPEKKPKFVHGTHAGYGIDLSLMKRFEDFLDYLREDLDVEVVTFEEYLKIAPKVPPIWGDGAFSTGSEKSDEECKKFLVNKKNTRVVSVENEAVDEGVLDFSFCFLPQPSLYYETSKCIMYADEIMTGHLWVYQRIESMEYNLESFDWNVQYSKVPRTFQLYLQSLNPVQALVLAYEKSRHPKYLEFAYKFILNWWEYCLCKNKCAKNPYVWNDHAVALRAENILYFGQACAAVGIWSDEYMEKIQDILCRHGEWLCDDANYTRSHNHGIIQDQALLHLGIALHKVKWVEHAKKRLAEQRQAAFNDEMVHVENSPGYANHVINMLRKIGECLQKNGDETGNKWMDDVNLAQEYLYWTMKPNGIIAQIGDTGNFPGKLYGPEEKQRRMSENIHKIYPKTGVYFYRSNYDSDYKLDTWKTIKSGYESIEHKHADDCSFMLYSKGYEVFADGGIYGYTNDDYVAYFTSAKAHNTVIVDDSSYVCDMSRQSMIGFKGYQWQEQYDHVRAYNNAYDGVMWERDFCSADDLTVIMDTLESENDRAYSQVFHLAENMELLKYSDNEVLIKISESGYFARIRQFGIPTQLDVIRGDLNVPGYGLISRAENHLDIITTIKFNAQEKNVVFATLITIEDENGNVRMGKNYVNASDIKYLSSEKAFKVGELTITCREKME